LPDTISKSGSSRAKDARTIVIENGPMLGFGPGQRVVPSSLDRVLRVGSVSVNVAQAVAFGAAARFPRWLA
jgi:hypothetical protein